MLAAAADPGAAALPAAIWGRRRAGVERRGSGVEEEQLTVALTQIPLIFLRNYLSPESPAWEHRSLRATGVSGL